jgi:hypothetical protein
MSIDDAASAALAAAPAEKPTSIAMDSAHCHVTFPLDDASERLTSPRAANVHRPPQAFGSPTQYGRIISLSS